MSWAPYLNALPMFRFTDKKAKFREAIVDCLTYDPAHYGPTVNLIRIGQLRKFRTNEKKGRLRVDAIKSEVTRDRF